MFSGIIEEVGKIVSFSKKHPNNSLCVSAPLISKDSKVGDSIAVNGTCLTLCEKKGDILWFNVLEQTARLTNLSRISPRSGVNLERALKVGERISGHFVTGHIDCTGVVTATGVIAGDRSFEIAFPEDFGKYLLPKGSIAVDGISLTLGKIKPASFVVFIIPHTLNMTNLKSRQRSDRVNLEFDILSKRPDALRPYAYCL